MRKDVFYWIGGARGHSSVAEVDPLLSQVFLHLSGMVDAAVIHHQDIFSFPVSIENFHGSGEEDQIELHGGFIVRTVENGVEHAACMTIDGVDEGEVFKSASHASLLGHALLVPTFQVAACAYSILCVLVMRYIYNVQNEW